ncbi:hypothetical protein CLOLEP_01889 [[Clostridium] leptum DSM 753]|uniref:Uncharacterized protein n=1 Tax=[Clostridium] leptum DSM 753 TaxID=428125 RepID=A7VTJ8_9FIRM|nr:hypothetical protein CLOLEP_01889 [[Clostridium] leptum DSM 753]
MAENAKKIQEDGRHSCIFQYFISENRIRKSKAQIPEQRADPLPYKPQNASVLRHKLFRRGRGASKRSDSD